MNTKRKISRIKEQNSFTFKGRQAQTNAKDASDPTGSTVFTIPTITRFC